jgi:mannosyltransferase OCH1-like enzyme
MQTWKDQNIPDHWQESPKSIKENMKDWTYVLMTDEDNLNFCEKYFPDFLPYFKSFPHGIQRADAIRYLWLYKYGGLYLDLDIVVVKPLDSLFYSDSELYLCSSGNVGSCLTNSLMASKPGCDFWLKMIDYMKTPSPWWAYGKHLQVMNTTGPVALNYMIKKEGYSYLALPAKYVMPCSVCNITNCKIGNSYLRPLVGSSWISWDTRVMNFFMCNWKAIIIALVLIIILFIIYFILYYMGVIPSCRMYYELD